MFFSCILFGAVSWRKHLESFDHRAYAVFNMFWFIKHVTLELAFQEMMFDVDDDTHSSS